MATQHGFIISSLLLSITVRDGRFPLPRLTPGHVSRTRQIPRSTPDRRSEQERKKITKRKNETPSPSLSDTRVVVRSGEGLKNSRDGRRRGGISSPARKAGGRTRRIIVSEARRTFFLTRGNWRSQLVSSSADSIIG